MTASSRGSRAMAMLMRSSRHPQICADCISLARAPLPKTASSQTSRSYATAPASMATSRDIHALPQTSTPSVTNTNLEEPYEVHSGILLSRAPLLTANPHPFESAFWYYQKRLNERLALPFTRYFYFKKDAPAEANFKTIMKSRKGAVAHELGSYNAYDKKEGWNDELLVGDESSSQEALRESLCRDQETKAVDDESQKEIVERPLPRATKSDSEGDVRRLDRKLDRSLYLVVQRKEGWWGFPSAEIIGREALHQAAERILVQTAGVNMNTWIIGRVPVGFLKYSPHYADQPTPADAASNPANPQSTKVLQKKGKKTFFLKGRILAGQADLKDNKFGFQDFQWLTKDEVKKVVSPTYWSYVQHMMANR